MGVASMGVALWALSGCHSEWIIIQMNYWCRGETRTGAKWQGEGKGGGEAAAEEKAPLEAVEKGHQCELLLDCERSFAFRDSLETLRSCQSNKNAWQDIVF